MTRRTIRKAARNQARTAAGKEVEAYLEEAIRRGEIETKMVDGRPVYRITAAGAERLAQLQNQTI